MTAVSPGTWTDPEIAATMGRLNFKVAVARCLKIEKVVGSLLEMPTVGEGDKRGATRSGVFGLRDDTSFLATFFIITESAVVCDEKLCNRTTEFRYVDLELPLALLSFSMV